jgi:hypothetical protein
MELDILIFRKRCGFVGSPLSVWVGGRFLLFWLLAEFVWRFHLNDRKVMRDLIVFSLRKKVNKKVLLLALFCVVRIPNRE